MDSKIKIVRIKEHTPEWHEFRESGIGGSEVGTILGINKYDTAARLYHEKIGSVEPKNIGNNLTFWGHMQEDNIANTWRYWDGTKDGYVENYKNNKIVRECRNINGYAINPKYPWLFGSLDRLININGGFSLVTGEQLDKEGVLELKNMGMWAYNAWEDGIPIYFLTQVHQYMIITETDYAEIAMLVDGNRLVVEPVERDEALCERIINITKSFWYDRVLPGREAMEKRGLSDLEGNIMESERYEGIINSLEPDPDESEAYKEFMTDKFLKEREMLVGSMEMFELAKRDRFLMSFKSKIEKQRTLIQNTFLKVFTENGTDAISFDKLGTVSWNERKGQKNRTFKNGIKDKPSEDIIDERFDELDTEY